MKKILLVLPLITLLAVSCNKTNSTSTQRATISDTVLLNKSGSSDDYLFNISTKQITKVPAELDPKALTGLPEALENDTRIIENRERFTSLDKTKVIIYSTTQDKTGQRNDFSGEYPTIREEYYLCETSSKTCTLTNMLDYADAHSPIQMGCWFQWDSENNLFFGTPCGEGGGGDYVAIYDSKNKTIKKIGNDHTEQGKKTNTFQGSFTPNLQKFFITSEDVKTKKVSLLIYSVKDISKPIKSIDITSIIKDKDVADPTYTLGWNSAWTQDESKIFFAARNKIYSIDTSTGNIDLIAPETKIPVSNFVLSSNERYIVYTDDSGEKQHMNAIDLRDNNKIIDLLSEYYITLIHTH